MLRVAQLLTLILAAATFAQGGPEPGTVDETHPGDGVLKLETEPGMPGELADRSLRTHAVLLRSPALVRSVTQLSDTFRKTAFFGSLQKQNLDPTAEVRKRFRVDVIPGTLLLRLYVVGDDVNPTDRRVLIQSIADQYIKNCQAAAFDQTNAELVATRDKLERFDRMMVSLRERIDLLLAQESTPAIADELSVLREERADLRRQKLRVEDDVVSLRAQLRTPRSPIKWMSLPETE